MSTDNARSIDSNDPQAQSNALVGGWSPRRAFTFIWRPTSS